jgi:hypothetical protein
MARLGVANLFKVSRQILFLVLCLVPLRFGYSDGFVWLDNRTPTGDAYFTPSGPEIRAGMFLIESNRAVALYPQTNFRGGGTEPPFARRLLNPVKIRVPGRSPGDEVMIILRIFDGEQIRAESLPLSLRLGTETEPATLSGLVGASILCCYDKPEPDYVDPHFQTSVTNNDGVGRISSIVQFPSGGLLIGGEFTHVNGTQRFGMARVTEEGELDETFAPQLPENSRVNAIVPGKNGFITVGGVFPMTTGTVFLARLNRDGELDNTFVPTVTNEVSALELQGDGKLLVGTIGPIAEMSRLLTNGVTDMTFARSIFENPEGTARVRAIAARGVNSIWVGGEFNQRNGEITGSFVQLDGNGEIDTSVFPVIIEGAVYTIGGTDLIGGAFNRVNGGECTNLVRVSNDSVTCGGAALGGSITNFRFGEVRFISENGDSAILGESRSSGEITNVVILLPFHGPVINVGDGLIRTGPITAMLRRASAFDLFAAAGGQLKRFSNEIIPETNRLMGVDIYDDFLLLRPEVGWGEEFEVSADLQKWTMLPNKIRDTNVTTGARFYRVKPR